MQENPTCPNLRTNDESLRAHENNNDRHAFQCTACHLVFMTPDHQPVHNQLK